MNHTPKFYIDRAEKIRPNFILVSNAIITYYMYDDIEDENIECSLKPVQFISNYFMAFDDMKQKIEEKTETYAKAYLKSLSGLYDIKLLKYYYIINYDLYFYNSVKKRYDVIRDYEAYLNDL